MTLIATVTLVTKAGYEVHAISGKADQAPYLKSLGASEVLGRDALEAKRPLESVRFGGGLDNVGGPMLVSLLAQTAPYGNVAAAGLAIPQALLTQLAPGGRLIAPEGGANQRLVLIERTGAASWKRTELEAVRFVPLRAGIQS